MTIWLSIYFPKFLYYKNHEISVDQEAVYETMKVQFGIPRFRDILSRLSLILRVVMVKAQGYYPQEILKVKGKVPQHLGVSINHWRE